MPGMIVWIRDRVIASGMEAAALLGQTFRWPRENDDSSLILQALEEKLQHRLQDGTLTKEGYELVCRTLGELSNSDDLQRGADLMNELKRGLQRQSTGDEMRRRLLKELYARRN